jgi:hypothetical protein
MKRCAVKSLILASVTIGLMPYAASTSYAGAGAIYYSPSDGAVGTSYGQEDFAAAFRVARNMCTGSSCRLVLWEMNRCIYLATGKNNAYGVAFSSEEAIRICSAYTTGCYENQYVCN